MRSRVSQISCVYDYPRDEPAQKGVIGQFADEGLAEAHFTGLKIGPEGERPRHRALRHWSWHSDDLEHELRDADGTLLARIESNAGRHRLTHPRTWPILSWSTLAKAMERARSVALTAIGLATIKAEIAKPNPMGAPLNRDALIDDGVPAGKITGGAGADMPGIPDFLRRTPSFAT